MFEELSLISPPSSRGINPARWEHSMRCSPMDSHATELLFFFLFYLFFLSFFLSFSGPGEGGRGVKRGFPQGKVGPRVSAPSSDPAGPGSAPRSGPGGSPCPAWDAQSPPIFSLSATNFYFHFLSSFPCSPQPPRSRGRAHPPGAGPGSSSFSLLSPPSFPFQLFSFPIPFPFLSFSAPFPSPLPSQAGLERGGGGDARDNAGFAQSGKGLLHIPRIWGQEKLPEFPSLVGGRSLSGSRSAGETPPEPCSSSPTDGLAPSPPLPRHFPRPSPQPQPPAASHKVCDVADNAQGFFPPPPFFFFKRAPARILGGRARANTNTTRRLSWGQCPQCRQMSGSCWNPLSRRSFCIYFSGQIIRD